jgi:amino acid adenylation domain-containing protein/non-ribosomal peptide synthase protein (TIGR01720 family)
MERSGQAIATLVDVLRSRAEEAPEAPAYTFLPEGEADRLLISRAGLDQQARVIATALRAALPPGGRAVLLYPPGLDYVAGFFGCLYAGVIAVPAYPPDPSRIGRTLPRLRAIVADARADVVLTTALIASLAEGFFQLAPDLRERRWIATDTLPQDASSWEDPGATADTVAFLQYTSGSTGSPKGVILTHGNLVANLRSIRAAMDFSPSTVMVSWLPPYHDMGLIGGILAPLFAGGQSVLMPPVAFLQRPLRWVAAVSRFKGTVSGGPNFSFDLSVRKTTEDDRRALDLSAWRVAFSGAEPVRAGTVARFVEAFAVSGLHPDAVYPCYGLAEATLMVTGGRIDAAPVSRTIDAGALEQRRVAAAEPGDPAARTVVGCGEAVMDDVIAIVDPETGQRCPPDRVGEIWVFGPNVAAGYWMKQEETAQAFQARLPGDDRNWLRTGDLGYLDGGELYVTGRHKDLIILFGRNHYPQDVEHTAEESHPALRRGCAAAFALDTESTMGLRPAKPGSAPYPAGEERLAIVIEIERGAEKQDLTPVYDAIRAAVVETHDVRPHTIALVRAGSIPKTSSGKIQRRECRAALVAGTLGEIGKSVLPDEEGAAAWTPPRTPVEEAVAQAFAEVLGADRVGARDDFFALGGHSLMGTQLVTRLRAAFGVDLPLRDLFEAPTVARLAARIEAVLAGGAGARGEPLVRAPEGEAPVASFGQEGLWLLAQLDPGDASYRLPVRMRIDGPLDAAVLGRALSEIVRRHEVLRTTFAPADGRPVPVVHDAADLPLPVVSLAALPEDERAAALRREEQEEIGRPFDLVAGPLLRARLIEISAAEHVLLLTVHHIVADAWTMAVVGNELAALYAAFAEGKPSPLPDLPIQFTDYARWQRRHVTGEVEERLLAYWRAELEGASPALDLPADRPRPPVLGHRGAERTATLPPDLAAALAALARREGVTLFMVLLAAFEALIFRYTDQTDFVVGTPIANRRHVETEGLAGFFVNTLALRARLSPAQTFRDLLVRVKEACLGAYAHQDIPFERLVQVLAPVRDASRSPLFQVMMVLQNAPLGRMELPGAVSECARGPGSARHATIEGTLLHTASSKFDLTLTFTEAAGGITAAVEHSTDLFDAATIERMVGHLQILLAGAAARPSLRLHELPLMGDAEREAVLAAGRASAAFPVEAPLHAIFEAQVDRTPEAPAVTYEGESLSYRDLDRRANRVAHALRRRGVQRGTLVGLCVDRSLDLVVGLVGILKAGGAYVPLDPSYPRERLAFMIDDAGAAVVVTHREHASIVAGASLLRLDADADAIAAEPEIRPEGGATPGDVAYVLYTSGSTGRPKGTMVTHRNVARLFPATQAWYGFGPADVWTVFHSYAFDFSVWELWGALLHGGRAVVVPYWVSRSPEAFLDLLARERVTVLNQTPSAFRALVHADGASKDPRDPALRWVIFGGEALDVGDLAPWWDRHGDARPQLVNMYGITETTVHVTYRPVSRADLERPWSSVIGVPIPDLSAHVLDAALQPVPLGVAGELCVGGAGVALGYLNRPELSSQRFVPDPFDAGGRLYRSGDLARRTASGDLVYLGRIDQQVKIRGFRIELGEIEAALGEHPGVRAVVVMARETPPEGKQLVAYVVPAEGAAPGAPALRAFLKDRLPEYMVPAAFVSLAALPLTSNGKVDRAALPAPEIPAERAGGAPRGPVEEAVCGVLADVLRRPDVGPHESFFDLGGHSLLATQVVSRLRAAFGVDLPLRALFEAPTAADLAARLDAALRGGAGVEVPPVTRAPREGGRVLSFAQERMWFLHRLDPGDTSYLVPGTLRLGGALDRGALGRAIDEAAQRHEVLRTRYVAVDGKPSAIVDEGVHVPLPVVDLAALPEADRDRALAEAIAAEARRPFDLGADLPIRLQLFAIGAEDHALLVVMHHIATDGWSVGVLLRELGALYEAFQAGQPSPLPALPIAYADYAAWQRAWLAGEVEGRQLAYWTAQLAGAPEALDLPADRPRPPVMSHRGGRAPLALGAPLSGAIGALARRAGATLFMVLLAAFAALLRRHAGERDVVVGTPIAGRTRAETEGVIGLFVNTLALRTRVDDDAPFTDLIRQARETCLGAYAHQDLPFERLVEELRPARDLSRTPIFQVMLVLENAAREEASFGGLRRRLVAADAGTTKFDLTLSLRETAQGLEGEIEFFADLFDAATIDRLAGHLRVLLEGAVEAPGRRVADLPMLPAEERDRVLLAWNRTAADHPQATFAALFEAQVDRDPGAPAILHGREVLSYGELDARSNRLAHHLRGLGVGPESIVGISMPRSPDLVVAVVGVVKAGGAWLPLDPTYPRDRLAFILEDAQPALVLAGPGAAESLPETIVPVLRVDAEAAAIAREEATRPAPIARAGSAAYVIYTSGSTGRPKGVVVEHRGLGNLAAVHHAAFGSGPGSRVLQFSSPSFDASVWETVMALLNGGALVLAPQEALMPGPDLLAVLEEQAVTTVTLPPSALSALPDAALPALRTIVVAGEACSEDLVLRWAPGRQFVDAYGPTETTVCASMTECAPTGDKPLIGRPLANMRTYVLDGALDPQPIGVPGELFVGGVGLARGYLRRPDLTAERFVPDPFGDAPGARLYRTGDLARWTADGLLDYVGRADTQVKVRGFRIELGEIEAALASHPGVREAVVVAWRDAAGQRLVAYVVPADLEAPPHASALRGHLQDRLPEYMVPSAFVALDRWPLTPSGKVDRRALPAPGLPAGRDHVPPRGPVEEAVARVFGDVLGIDPRRVGAQDGFFELGGHSLLATQVVSRVRTTFGVELPVRALFEAPTPADLAARIEALLRAGAGVDVPPITPAPRGGPLPLSFAQERMWFLHGLDPHDAAYLVSGTLRLEGPLDRGALGRALDETVQRHEVLRTRFALVDGRGAGVVEEGLHLALDVVDLTVLPAAEREAALAEAIAADARRPIDLEAGPPIRVKLFAIGAEDHVLLVVIHHIATDAWSMGVLQGDLAALYDAFHAGRPSPLPALPIQYADYAAWQRTWLSGALLDRELAWWKAHLAGAPLALDLPTDRPRPPVMSHRGGSRTFTLPPALHRALDALARREGATLFMVLLAAFDVLLARHAGQRDVVVGTPIAGRTRAETERLVGFFVNTLALRVELSDDEPFRGLLARVREACLGAYAHQDLPFERLVEALNPPRDLSRTPVFQVMLALQNAPQEDEARGGLRRRGVAADTGTARFDLLLVMDEGPAGLSGSLEYAADLFDAATIDRMVDHLRVLLEGVVEAPERAVADLPILAGEERRRLLAEHCDGGPLAGAPACMHRLVEDQVDRTPEATALIDGEVRLSYRALDERANRLAHHLRSAGVGPGVLVGLGLPRSADMVIGMLAILKAGGAYVPIDLAYPAARIAQFLEDAHVLVTRASARATLPESAARAVLIDAEADAIAGRSAARPEGGADPRDLGYVLYTSGSTGRSKGVAIEHRSAAALVRWAQGVFSPEELSCVLLATSICFDLSVFEIFVPLATGGAVVVAANALALPSLPAREEVTLINTVPSAMAELVRGGNVPARVTTVCLAGEPLPAQLADHIHALPQVERLYNLYGPTEDTTYSTWSLVERGTTPNIGRPISGSTGYVLDAHLTPVPIGVVGELYLGGAGLARGYHRRPDLTAERFVPDPFGAAGGGRLYRTGDLTRYRADGALEYLGRADHLVKVRGFRVELGEIEAVLLGDPTVRETVVVVREDAPGDKRIVAYVAPSEGAGPLDGATLAATLRRQLPEYMVPSAFVVMDALPRTQNGKVDRKALPAPEVTAGGDVVAPAGPVEEAVVRVFADVLKVPADRVGARHGFFELGGHSLLATQAVSRLRATFGVDLPIRALFEAPTPADLAARIEAALRGGAGVEIPPITRAAREGPIPLSFAQERMWFLHELDPDDVAYLVPAAIRMEGALDRGALARTLDEVVRRHEVLRTRVATVDGAPVAIVDEGFRLELPVVDLGSRPAAERERAAREAIAAELRRPFDLGAEPPIRATLFALGEGDHLLFVVIHHIATDAWSVGALSREVSALYEAFAAGRPSPLPELPLQYGDFAAWQRRWLTGEILDRQLAYWKAALAGAPDALSLPADRARPAVRTSRGGRVVVDVPEALTQGLRALAERRGATLYMVLLAALDVLLYRLSGEKDLVVGAPIAGRTHAETEGMVGVFLNMLALRASVEEEEPFTALLARVKETCLGAYAHQDLPFERLVQEIGAPRDPSRTPVFQVFLNLRNAPAAASREEPEDGIHLAGVRLSTVDVDTETTKFDLTFILVEGPRGITGTLTYRADLFDAGTVERWVGHLYTLLGAVVADPERRVGALPLVSAEERRRLVAEQSAAIAGRDVEACVHALFEAQADRTPGMTALVAGAARMTFAELDARSNQLAHRLRRMGVGPDAVVGLCMDRTAGLIVGLLGVLKAGGAYLPLDPTLPRHRLQDLLDEARAAGVVTAGAAADALPDHAAWRVRLDADEGGLAAESAARPEPTAQPDHLAYVLFTSGSTGRPKGVAVEHRNLAAYVRGAHARLAPPPGGSYAHVSTLAADLGNTTLFLSLCTGGTLHLVAEDLTKDPAGLGAYFEAEGIDAMKIAPSHLAALLAAPRPERVVPRRALVLGGEALRWDVVDRIHALSPGCRVFNHYGPTETTVGVIAGAAAELDRQAPIVPLGRPLQAARVYVVDPQMEPMPTGVPGEVLVGGAQVARGYLGRPDQTAERFVPDPFGPGGARLYRTGDRARRLADGSVLFLGRVDHQVKVRGYRVELGEVEAVLAQHPGVREAVVLALDDAAAGKRLAAFVAGDPRPAPADLGSFLAERLPAYMVPGTITALDAMPITPNGKVDRRALEAMERREEEAREIVAPRTPTEEVLEAIWADVFGRERVGVHERFDDLGGHSLLAIQVIARVRDAFQVEVPLRALFEAPTIAALGERVEALAREGAAASPPIERASRGGPLPLSFAQERLWFLDSLEPGSPFYNVPSAQRLKGSLDAGALERAIGEVVRRHEVLRTTYAMSGDQPVQVIHDDLAPRLPVEDLSALPPAEREERAAAIVSAEAQRPFDLARGPVLRARLLRLGPEDHVLAVVIHHIASDAGTQRVLLSEVARLYAAFRAGEPSPLPPLAIQYADYAVWQRRWLSGDVLAQQVAWWKGHLAGAPAALDLPTDRPRPAVMSHRGGRRPFALAPETHRALAAVGRREGATLFMVLLAAFDVLLRRYTGQRDVVVGMPILGRTRAETEALIGFFVNTLALRVAVEDDLPFTGLLARVREACLGAYAHQDLPFERLVEELNPVRDLSRTPLFQAMLVLQNARREQEEDTLAGLTRTSLVADSGTVRFDLTLTLSETSQGLEGLLEYAADLFDATTIERMASHLHVLLEGVVEGADRPVIDLPLLPAAERDLVIGAWNRTGAPYPGGAVGALFEAQVDRAPGATALVHGDTIVRYAELDARANQIARHLQRRGVGAGALVGLCMDRSPEMVAAMIGVLKAGAAWVPLDPAYPEERLAFMIEDAGPSLILVGPGLGDALPRSAAPLLRLDVEGPRIAEEPAGRPASPARSRDAAYVIYTSGSTGRPKGVVIEHEGLANLAAAQARAFGVTAGSRVLQFASSNFDASVSEVFVTLLAGAALVLAPQEALLPGPDLVRTLVDGRVSVVTLPPSALSVLPDAALPSLETLVVAGEACPKEIVARWADQRRFVNAYGPTETTVCATLTECAPSDGKPLIGRPIANMRTYVLDAGLTPAPVGVPGELYVGGVGVARGYLGRPDLTAARFVPDPFGGEPGARLYRTGDVARWLPDGRLDFVGRADTQVKVRGYRIELGEIEAALAAHARVREAVAVARGDVPGHLRIVGYVASALGADPPDAGELRAFLKDRLPEYMVPSAFVVLDDMPRTPSGKVDRAALPAPDGAADRDHVAPRGDVEEVLCRVFAEVLRIGRVGVHDNFFAIGGDSILSMQVVSRARAAGIEITPRQIFQHQTVAELAVVAGVARARAREEGPVTGPVPLTPVQRWWLSDDPVDPHHFNQSVLLEAASPMVAEALEQAVGAVLEHHDALRLRVSRGEQGHEQQIVPYDGTVPFERVDLGAVPEGERTAALSAAAARAQASLDLARGPMLRVVLFSASGFERLLVAVHHFAVDGVSWRILLEDLWTAYEARRRGEPVVLPARTTSIQRWARALVDHARSEAVAEERGYWLSAARRRVQPLPVDMAGGDGTEAATRTVEAALSPEETEALLRAAPEAYRTRIDDILLTALAQVLWAWTGADTALVDLEGHGREEIFDGLSPTRTVGWFTAIYPVILERPAGAGLGETLVSVKEQLRAVPSHGVGYGLLRYLRGDEEIARALAALPQAEVSFNYLGQLDQALPGDAPLRGAREGAGPSRSPRGRRRHAIDVVVNVAGGRLSARFAYAGTRHRPATVEGLAERFVASLRALVAHCVDPRAGGATPSDLRDRGKDITHDVLDFIGTMDPSAGGED